MKNAAAFCQALKKILEEQEVIDMLEEASQEILEGPEEKRAFDLEREIVQRTPKKNLVGNKEEILQNIDRAQLQALGNQINSKILSDKIKLVVDDEEIDVSAINFTAGGVILGDDSE